MIPGKVHALSIKYNGISNVIVSDVEIKNPFNGLVINSKGIWDTGAQGSVVTKKTADKLGPVPIGKTMIRGVHGTNEVNVYRVQITLNNKDITLTTNVTESDELSADDSTGMLIGMNVINMGDFSVSNYLGKTAMSFRVPSQRVIDYVEGIRHGNPIISDKIPGRNEPCPCGSGKKFKYCCITKKPL